MHTDCRYMDIGARQAKRIQGVRRCLPGMLLIGLFLFITSSCGSVKDPLTPEERDWLGENDGKIIVNNESGWPPIIDTDNDGRPYGIVMDFQRLLEEKLSFRFKMDRPDSWKNFMERFRRGEIDVNNNLQKTPRRSEYALFTEPYIEIPNAIIVRKEIKGSLTPETLRGMTVAVTKNFAIHHHLEKNHGDLNLVPLKNELACLLDAATRNVDAAVVNLAVASFHIEQKGIANLRIAGYADYTNALCFASRKDLPILNRILQKGLEQITRTEREAIFRKWISLGYIPFYKSTRFWVIAGGAAAAAAAVIALVIFWNLSLTRLVRSRTASLESTNLRLSTEVQERSRIEEALRVSEEKYRRLAENSPDMIYRISLPDGTYEYVSPAAEGICGYPPDHLYAHPKVIEQMIHPDWSDYFTKEWERLCDGYFSPSYEYQIVHRDGESRWIHQRNVPVRNRDGNLIAIEGIVTDITARKQAEEDFRTAHERFLTVLNSIDATVYVADMETHEILFMNQFMQESFGRDMTGEVCWKAFRGNHAPCGHCTNDRLVDAEGKPTGVCVWQDRNPINGKHYVNHDRAVEWTDGRLVRLQVATDISELVRMEEQLLQAQKMESIGRLAGGIAHDFNNMLSIISGNLEMILEDAGPANPFVPNLLEIQKAAGRSADLTRQMLAFARKQTVAPKVLDLNRTVDEMLKILQRLIGENIDLVWRPHENLWPVRMDPSQVDQVLANLCVNAKDSIEGVGKVTIETNNVRLDEDDCLPHQGLSPGDHVLLVVSDSGRGMDRKTREKIFGSSLFHVGKSKSSLPAMR